MWAESSYEDLIHHNDEFKTGLIGTPEQIAERIAESDAVDVDLILTGHLHFTDDLPAFGWDVIPAVRALTSRCPSELSRIGTSDQNLAGVQ